LHETVERRRREAIAFAAGQIARRHERRCFGCGNAHDQEHHGDHAQPIGKNAVTLAYRYWAKGGTKRRATPNMDLSWRSQAPGD